MVVSKLTFSPIITKESSLYTYEYRTSITFFSVHKGKQNITFCFGDQEVFYYENI